MATDPLEFFKTETSHPDAPVRTEAMRKLVVVVALVGAERARNQLLPYLQNKIGDLDQVLLAMSQKVGDLVPHIGGAEHTTALIPLLELLCAVEETCVRAAAAASASKIISFLENNSACKTQAMAFFELVLRLANDEESEIFYSRVSVCHFLPEMHRALPAEMKPQLRELYAKLLVDEMIIVRRAAATAFLRLADGAEAEHLRGDLLSAFKSMASDENPTVKLIAVESLARFAELLKRAGGCEDVLRDELLPLLRAAAESPSWQVRKTLVQSRFSLLAQAFAQPEVADAVFPALLQLTQDQEPDVRVQALKEMLPFCEAAGHTAFLAAFAPVAAQLVDDPSAESRKALLLLCIDVGAKVGPEAVALHLSDVILRLTVDEDPLVRLRLLQRLHVVAEETPSLCARLTEHVQQMLSDANWRVRKQAAQACPAVMQHLGKEYVQENLLAALLSLLHDGVDEVRTGVTEALPRIAALGGADWAYEHIFPAVRAMQGAEFLVRLSMLTALQGLLSEPELAAAAAAGAGGGQLQPEALALLVAATNDKVPNVRLRAAQVLGAACKALGPESSRTSIRPVLAALQQDKDRDVAFFASESIKVCA